MAEKLTPSFLQDTRSTEDKSNPHQIEHEKEKVGSELLSAETDGQLKICEIKTQVYVNSKLVGNDSNQRKNNNQKSKIYRGESSQVLSVPAFNRHLDIDSSFDDFILPRTADDPEEKKLNDNKMDTADENKVKCIPGEITLEQSGEREESGLIATVSFEDMFRSMVEKNLKDLSTGVVKSPSVRFNDNVGDTFQIQQEKKSGSAEIASSEGNVASNKDESGPDYAVLPQKENDNVFPDYKSASSGSDLPFDTCVSDLSREVKALNLPDLPKEINLNAELKNLPSNRIGEKEHQNQISQCDDQEKKCKQKSFSERRDARSKRSADLVPVKKNSKGQTDVQENKITKASNEKTLKTVNLYLKISGRDKKDFNISGYISAVLPRKMEFQILQVYEDKTENTIFVVQFPDKRMANYALKMINQRCQGGETKMYAFKQRQRAEFFTFMSEHTKEKILEKHIDQITERAQKILTEHSKKIEVISSDIEKINVSMKKERRQLSLEQFQIFDAERKAFKDKKKELETQRNEFMGYIKSMHSKIEELSISLKFEREMTEIRQAFGVECLRFSNALPMYARRSDILTVVKENQVSVILGETGSGKSTQMPQYLHQAGFAKNGLIVCTQPRKLAAISLATHVAAEMASSVGHLVGYQVGMKVKKSHDTQILYVTDHVLLNDCLKDELLSAYSCIIVDEAHERSIYTDLLLGMIKKCLNKRPELRVVITSATIDPDVFVKYFQSCPILKVSGRMFPVEECWNAPELQTDIFEKYESLAVEKAVHVHKTESAGDILVFLTSPLEAERCCESFKNRMGQRTDFICHQLHGKLQADAQQKVFEPVAKGKRKVVFATNSAETSITIPGIKYVIDTGLAKEMQFDPKRGINSLNVTMITKSSAEQRKGRAGRTTSGKCFRLYTKEEFNQMRPNNVPEILRVHLGHAILKLMELGVAPLEFEFVESPSHESLEAANESLEELGAVSDDKITDLGKWVAKLPIDPKFGVFLFEGLKRDICFEAMIIAACAVSGPMFFRAGTDAEKEKADRLKVRFCQPDGDLITMLSVYREWHMQPEKQKGQWCYRNCINGKVISSVRETMNEIRKILKTELKENVKFEFGETENLEIVLAEMIFKVLRSNICHYLGHQKAGYLAVKKDQVVQVHPSSALLPLGGYPEWIVFQQVLKTSREYALMVTPVSEEIVKKAVSEGWLKLDMEKVKERKLVEVYTEFIGIQLFREFVGPRYRNLKSTEEKLLGACENSTTLIDAVREKGQLKVYSSQKYEKTVSEAMKEALVPIKTTFMAEEVEEQIATETNAIRALIGAGGCVKVIYMPEEFSTVLIHCSVKMTQDLTKEEVTECFEKFGPVKSCRKNRYNPKFPSIWGQLTFTTTETALKAVSATRGNVDISAHPSVRAATRSGDEFRTKITWCRRESKGFGFAELVNVEDIPRVTVCRNIMVGGSVARVTPAKNSLNQVYVGKFNRFVTEDVLRQSVANTVGLHPENDVGKVSIIRERVTTTPEILVTLKNRLRRKIEEYTTKDRYTLELRNPTDTAINYTAFASFKNPEEGYLACKEMSQDFLINGEAVQMKADLKSSIYVFKRIYDKNTEEIQECIQILEDQNQNVKIKIKELRNGNVIIDLHTDSLEGLVGVKRVIHNVVKGDVIDALNNPLLKKLFTYNGRQKLEAIMKETDTVILTDFRIMTISVHGKQGNRTKALGDINKYLDELSHGGLKTVDLKGSGKPPGVMKKLMETFSSDLSQLATEAKLTNVEIEQRYHRLKLIGSEESLQKAMDIINGIATDLINDKSDVNGVEQPDCLICFCPIEDDELYRLECCGHPYCKDCVKRQIEISVSGRDFPLKCSDQDCELPWAWKDINNMSFLGYVSKPNLVSSSVSCFVQQNKDLYHYCISPDCPVVYKVSKDGEVFRCPVCEVKVCTACHVQSHDGLTCAMYNSMKEDDGSLALWLKQNPDKRKICPNCTTPIEKIAGCNNMTCIACKKCICWNCLAFFDDEQGCYAHLQKEHGGFQ